MTDTFFQISLALFTASITAASLTFIAVNQILIWISTVFKDHYLEGTVKLEFKYLRTTIMLFLISNILVIIFWLLPSWVIPMNIDYFIILSLLIFFIGILMLFFGVKRITKYFFFFGTHDNTIHYPLKLKKD